MSQDPTRNSTSSKTNQQLDREAAARVRKCAEAGPEALDQRIRELDQE